MKFEYMHHIINEDGNRIEWWSFDGVHLVVLPYKMNTVPDFANARVTYTDGHEPGYVAKKEILKELQEHMINLYKQQEYEQQI